ncbi:unnamed protein product [Closterium sp. NIES-53]
MGGEEGEWGEREEMGGGKGRSDRTTFFTRHSPTRVRSIRLPPPLSPPSLPSTLSPLHPLSPPPSLPSNLSPLHPLSPPPSLPFTPLPLPLSPLQLLSPSTSPPATLHPLFLPPSLSF